MADIETGAEPSEKEIDSAGSGSYDTSWIPANVKHYLDQKVHIPDMNAIKHIFRTAAYADKDSKEYQEAMNILIAHYARYIWSKVLNWNRNHGGMTIKRSEYGEMFNEGVLGLNNAIKLWRQRADANAEYQLERIQQAWDEGEDEILVVSSNSAATKQTRMMPIDDPKAIIQYTEPAIKGDIILKRIWNFMIERKEEEVGQSIYLQSKTEKEIDPATGKKIPEFEADGVTPVIDKLTKKQKYKDKLGPDGKPIYVNKGRDHVAFSKIDSAVDAGGEGSFDYAETISSDDYYDNADRGDSTEYNPEQQALVAEILSQKKEIEDRRTAAINAAKQKGAASSPAQAGQNAISALQEGMKDASLSPTKIRNYKAAIKLLASGFDEEKLQAAMVKYKGNNNAAFNAASVALNALKNSKGGGGYISKEELDRIHAEADEEFGDFVWRWAKRFGLEEDYFKDLLKGMSDQQTAAVNENRILNIERLIEEIDEIEKRK